MLLSVLFRFVYTECINLNVRREKLNCAATEEVLNRSVDQAFVRSGMSANTFNLQALSKSNPPPVDPTARIQALTRGKFARPVADVEAELGSISTAGRITAPDNADSATAPEDPSEDDFVV